MLIFQCILGLQSQSIDFTNDFSQADIPSGEQVFIVLPRYFKSMEDNVILLSYEIKYYMVKPRPHAYSMKSFEMFF